MRAAALLAGLLLCAGAAAEPAPPEGFRGPPYLGATPAAVPGGRTVGAAEVAALRAAGALLVDATPLTLGRVGAMTDRWVVAAPHESIAGALWLPGVGAATLEPRLEAWFRRHLGDDPARPLVFFCRADCWMSWNAAKRAAQWGHAAVHWFRDGIEAWRDHLGPLEWARPRPFGE